MHIIKVPNDCINLSQMHSLINGKRLVQKSS